MSNDTKDNFTHKKTTLWIGARIFFPRGNTVYSFRFSVAFVTKPKVLFHGLRGLSKIAHLSQYKAWYTKTPIKIINVIIAPKSSIF